MAIALNINGKTVQADAAPETPLLWVLRDTLGLTGTKFGCGIAQCGACTVHINSEPARSCMVTASAAVGAEITTIEGISKGGAHPVQLAGGDLYVRQSAYC